MSQGGRLRVGERSFPIEPLMRAARAGDPAHLARMLDLHPANFYRNVQRQKGFVTMRLADEWATRLGFHPAMIWGDDWWDACEYAELWQKIGSDLRRSRQRAREQHPWIVCRECGEKRRGEARGLCSSCWRRRRRSGT